MRVSGDEVIIEGDESVIDFTVPVVSIRTGEQLRFEDGKEEWARNLPNAYRAGDYVVDVFDDDNPVPPHARSDEELEREPYSIPQLAGAHR